MPVAVSKKTTGRLAKPRQRNVREVQDDSNAGQMQNAPEGYDPEEDLLKMEIPPPPHQVISGNRSDRLVISHLVVENFKSYFGRQIIGPFHRNFTAVIGPNGSGKSNVIDALLFVFGYRASKIRSKKLSVLIHSSAGKDNISSCTVSVYFQRIIDSGNNGCNVVEGSQFFVSRTAFSDNSSRYSLNGSRVANFKEISEILLSSGIDLIHNRFLILQGEVEQISLMKPKAENENEEGMLEYLEDIIGSNRLKLPISKLLYKLDGIQEKRAAQLLRLKYAEKERVALVEPVKELIVKLRLETAITIVKNKIFSCDLLKCSERITKLKSKRDEAVENLLASQSQMLEFTEQNVQLKSERKQLQKALDKCQLALSNGQTELSEKMHNLSKDQNDIARLAKKKKKTLIEIEKQELQIANLQDLPRQASERVEEYKLLLDEAEAAIKENSLLVQQKLDMVNARTVSSRQKREKVDGEISKHIVVEDEINSELVLAQEELNNLQHEEEKQHRTLAELNDQLAEMKQKISTKNNEFFGSQDMLPKYKQEYERLKSDCIAMRQNEALLVDRIRELKTEIEELRQSAEGFKSSNRLLQSLMKQKQEGNIVGIFGRLGDLGAIDEKYDVAISTTCGALDNIVVDSVDTAQTCIEYLKREKLGIASFIALDKQHNLIPHMRNKIVTPENAPRLFDMIRVADQQVLPAFYYALSDTLVADDITSATRIAMPSERGRRWRTVTLNGEVVEVSGAMTGGGNAQRSGKIGRSVKVDTSKASNDALKNAALRSKELEDSEGKLIELRQKLAKSDQDFRNRQADISRAETFYRNSRMDVENLEKSITSIQQSIELQKSKKKNSVVDPVVLQKAMDKVKYLRSESAKIKDVADDLQMEFITLTEEINKIEADIVGIEREKLHKAEEQKAKAENGIVTEKSSIASNDRNLSKAQRCKADLEADLQKIELSIERLTNKLGDADSRIAELNELVEKRKEEIRQAEEAFKDTMEKSKELNTEELAIQKRIKDLMECRQCMDSKIKDVEHKKAGFQKQISKLPFFDLKKLDDLPEEVRCSDQMDKLLRTVIFNVPDENSFDDAMETEDTIQNDELGISAMEVDINDADGLPLSNLQPTTIDLLPKYKDEQVREFNQELLEAQLTKLEDRHTSQKEKGISMDTLNDYNDRVKRFNNEADIFREISKQRDLHRGFCDNLRKRRLQEFMEGYRKINLSLKAMYQMITLGGDASLDLVDSLDPFSEGISFGVRPPKKSWKQIVNLSGGEKTLASLAFVFGLHQYRPTPLYVMDEIDAALDCRNVSILSHLLKERTESAQFVIISLRNNMYEKADRLVGIYKLSDCTKTAVLDPRLAEEERKKNSKALRTFNKKRHEFSQEVDIEEKFDEEMW